MAGKATRMAVEAQAENPEAVEQNQTGPSAAMLALFKSANDVQVVETQRLNLPTMLKPEAFPVGAVLQGEIVKFVDSPVSTIKGKLVWLRVGTSDITFPVTGVIREALAPKIKVDEADKLQKALDKHVGKVLTLKRTIDGRSKQYNRNVYMYDVFLSEVRPAK